ncbi:unnamed protein product [Paramecium sonneborni]|uniref:MORN repeat protein n=1 Tax=Paramecium sonneborni TaxID=65129 RepID=A0A8S1KV49_9CILI|nr:unnamed protein product [Paramecium sonneborni]
MSFDYNKTKYDPMRALIEQFINFDQELKTIYNQIDKSQPSQKMIDGFYRGETEKQIRKGKGEWISEDGNHYKIGIWQNNCLQGKGLVLYCIYEQQKVSYYEGYYGTFDKGKPDGQGTLKKSTKQIYEGIWKNGKMNGKGSIYIENSYYCKATFENNQFQGYGEIESKDANNYWKMIGNFIDKNNFNGEIFYKEGRYKGPAIYHQNSWQMHGNGTFIWQDGSYYNGKFSYNQRHGFAVSKYGKEGQEEMFWKDDKKYQPVKHN